MKRFGILLPLLLATSSASAADCGWLADATGICTEINKANEQITELRKAFKASADAAIRAVPGERYLQLIDALNSGDPEKEAEARRFLTRLANLEEGVKYQAVVNVNLGNPENSFRIDVFRGRLPSRETVDALRKQHSISLQAISSSSLFPKSIEQTNEAIRSNVASALDAVAGAPVTATTNNAPYGSWSVTTLADSYFRLSSPDPNELASRLAEMKQRFVDGVTGAILATVQGRPPNSVASPSRVIPWDPVQPASYLFVVIPKRDFDTQQSFEIIMSVSEVGDDKKTLYSRPPLIFTKDQFRPEISPPIVDDFLGEEIYWAFGEMTGQLTLSEGQLADIESLSTTLAKWDKGQE